MKHLISDECGDWQVLWTFPIPRFEWDGEEFKEGTLIHTLHDVGPITFVAHVLGYQSHRYTISSPDCWSKDFRRYCEAFGLDMRNWKLHYDMFAASPDLYDVV